MRSLLVTKLVPSPADSGGKLRSRAVAELLADLGHVDLVAFDDGESDHAALEQAGIAVHAVPRPRSRLGALRGLPALGSLSGARFWSPELAALIARLTTLHDYDVVQVEYAPLAPYARYARGGRVRVLDLHNVESALMASRARRAPAPLRAVLHAEARALARVERRAVRAFDVVLTVSDAETARLPSAPCVLTCPNGWWPSMCLPPAVEPIVVFVGLLGWGPNRDAALWLGREIWPEVERRVPGARLLIVGRDPDDAVRSLAAGSIEVVASPPDVRPFLARAAVAVAPLRAGGGSRLKILEALDAGRPLVATPLGAEGLERLVGRGVFLAETAHDLAGTIAELLLSYDRGRRAGLDGHAAVAEAFSWERTLAPLRFELERRVGRRGRALAVAGATA
jgi:glycosyltransferase involved in cell wall biosynthesis